MPLKQKFIHDAGVNFPKDLYEINDQGGISSSAPVSPYAISETRILTFTSGGPVEAPGFRFLSGDGQRIPGSTRVIGQL